MTESNNRMLDMHQQASVHALAPIKHVLVYKEGQLTLWNQQSNNQYKQSDSQIIIQDEYTHIKNIAHITVRVETLLQALPTMNTLQKIMELDRLYSVLYYLSQTLQDKHGQIIVKNSMELITTVKRDTKSNKDLDVKKMLRAYYAKLDPILDELGRKAAHVQLADNLENAAKQWLEKHKINLDKTRVLVVGPHGPREGNIEMQYFVNLYQAKLGVKNPLNDKCYYVESLPQHIAKTDIHDELILGFLAREEWNKLYGISRANNPRMMSSDLMAKPARPILSWLFGSKPSGCPVKYLQKKIGGLNVVARWITM